MAGNLRSPRKRALEIGTNSKGFAPPAKFDSAGIPEGSPSHGEYHDSAAASSAAGSKEPGPGARGSVFKGGSK